jgi:hypothetical protein
MDYRFSSAVVAPVVPAEVAVVLVAAEVLVQPSRFSLVRGLRSNTRQKSAPRRISVALGGDGLAKAWKGILLTFTHRLSA